MGSLTTFSAYTLQAAGAGRDPLMGGFWYALLSVAAGLLLAKGGHFLAAKALP